MFIRHRRWEGNYEILRSEKPLAVLRRAQPEAGEMTTREFVLSLRTDPVWRPLLEELSLLLADLTNDSRYKDRVAYIRALLADSRFPN